MTVMEGLGVRVEEAAVVVRQSTCMPELIPVYIHMLLLSRVAKGLEVEEEGAGED